MKVEIWSDVVCPWCYIGKRRFEAALALFPQRESVDVVWRSFELDPQARHQPGESMADVLAQKFGMDGAAIATMQGDLTALAAAEGLEFHLEGSQPTSTFDAHRLTHLAAHHGLEGEMHERLMRAHFTESRYLGDHDTLVELGTSVGLEADDLHSLLRSDAYADDVREDERRARSLAIRGVPCFAIDEKYGISGAQPAEGITAVLERAWSESQGLAATGGVPAGTGS